MHSKALAMLHEYVVGLKRIMRAHASLAKDEEDKLDRYPPTIRYLQKLGPTELSLIFDASRWVFKEESEMALQVNSSSFTLGNRLTFFRSSRQTSQKSRHCPGKTW